MKAGERFPDFVLTDENGDVFDSKLLQNIRYIIYFYPKDKEQRPIRNLCLI